jgi:hypothetical protein
VARRSWLLIAEVALLGGLAALAFPSAGSGYISPKLVSLTAAGPSPSTLKMGAGNSLSFDNADSVTHAVVFANGLCSLTIAPGEQSDTCAYLAFFVGSYAYSVDGKTPGMVDTTPAFRSVTLSARTHRIRRGERLTLHGRATWDNTCCEFATKAPFPVTVLARYAGSQPFKEIATVSMEGSPDATDVWHLKVRPGVATTYVAEVSGQPPGGQIWKQARSRPLTLRLGR